MHTHFNAGSDQNVSDLANSAGDSFAALAQSDIGMRITQLNGLPLLILLIAHLTIHVLIRSAGRGILKQGFAYQAPRMHWSEKQAQHTTYRAP